MTEASSRHRVALSTQWLHSNVPAQAVPAGFQETLLALLEALGRSDLAALVDLVRQVGYPKLFWTLSPDEWTFPYHECLRTDMEKLLRGRLHLPVRRPVVYCSW